MNSIYRDIAERTGGDIYIGVVGPVRTGKSTFVSQFIQKVILPNITDKNDKKRTVDELPQSADGKTIMTTQPKFVPSGGVKITLGDKSTANVRLIDCVGYPVDGAEGLTEDDKPRLVNTPWQSEPIPFEKAAELGTHIVASEHSTVAVVVTTDGSIGDIPRENYVAAEARTIVELDRIGKPYVVVVNSTMPDGDNARAVCDEIAAKYGATVVAVDVQKADKKTMESVVSALLREFPVARIFVNLPKWMRALSADNKVVAEVLATVKKCAESLCKMCDADKLCRGFEGCKFAENVTVSSLDMATGTITYDFTPGKNLYFDIIAEVAGVDVSDEYSLMSFVTKAAYAQQMYDRVKGAFDEADNSGYGVVYPELDKMTVDEPALIRQGNIYGILMHATAPSYHVIKVDVKADISPMIGTQQQSEYLLDQYKKDPKVIWNANMYGRSMAGATEESLMSKCSRMPTEITQKLNKTVGGIVNEKKGGMICVLL